MANSNAKVLEEFLKHKDEYVSEAINFGATCPEGAVELKTDLSYVENLDPLVSMTRRYYQKHLIDDNVAWNISVVLGTLLGEMIINERGWHWGMYDSGVPVVETDEGNKASPITKIHKIIISEEDDEGMPSDFYEGILALEQYYSMSEEERDAFAASAGLVKHEE